MPQGLPSVSAEVLTKALSESGFLIEASVARRLRSAKWFVSQTRSYRDTETGKVREVDLVASKIHISRELPAELTVQLVLECKAVRAGLIALGRPLEKWHGMIPEFLCQGVPNAFYGGHTVMVGKRRFVRMWPAINFLDLAPVFPPTLMPAGCHQVLRIESHNPKKASLTSGLSDLLLPLAKATVQLAGTPPEVPLPVTEIPLLDSTRPDTAASKNEHQAARDAIFRWTVMIPVLVIDGPLFFVNIDSRRPRLRRVRSALAIVETAAERGELRVPVMIMRIPYLKPLLSQCEVMQSHCLEAALGHKDELSAEYARLLRIRLDAQQGD